MVELSEKCVTPNKQLGFRGKFEFIKIPLFTLELVRYYYNSEKAE